MEATVTEHLLSPTDPNPLMEVVVVITLNKVINKPSMVVCRLSLLRHCKSENSKTIHCRFSHGDVLCAG